MVARKFRGRWVLASLADDEGEPWFYDSPMNMSPIPGLYIWQADGAVTMNEPELLDRYTVRFSWTSNLDDPTFWVYRNGVLATVTKATSVTWSVDPAEELVVEVLDDANAKPARSFPGRFTLHWQGTAGVDHYRIEESVSGVWTTRGRVADIGQNYFRWVSRWLEDETTHQFRIIPVGTNKNEGTPKTFSALMVRNPDVPDVNWSYDAGTKKVTISAK